MLFAGAPTWKGATCHSKNGSVSIKSIQTSKQPAANAPGYMFCIYNKEHILVPVWCLGRILLCLLFISKSILRLFEMAQFCVFLCCGSTIYINKKASRLSLLGLGSGTVVLMGPCKKTVFGTTGFISVCSYSHLSHKKALPLIGLQTGHKFGTY